MAFVSPRRIKNYFINLNPAFKCSSESKDTQSLTRLKGSVQLWWHLAFWSSIRTRKHEVINGNESTLLFLWTSLKFVRLRTNCTTVYATKFQHFIYYTVTLNFWWRTTLPIILKQTEPIKWVTVTVETRNTQTINKCFNLFSITYSQYCITFFWLNDII